MIFFIGENKSNLKRLALVPTSIPSCHYGCPSLVPHKANPSTCVLAPMPPSLLRDRVPRSFHFLSWITSFPPWLFPLAKQHADNISYLKNENKQNPQISLDFISPFRGSMVPNFSPPTLSWTCSKQTFHPLYSREKVLIKVTNHVSTVLSSDHLFFFNFLVPPETFYIVNRFLFLENVSSPGFRTTLS